MTPKTTNSCYMPFVPDVISLAAVAVLQKIGYDNKTGDTLREQKHRDDTATYCSGCAAIYSNHWGSRPTISG